MVHASFFSGIEGFGLAAQQMGWANAFHVEWNIFGRNVIEHHYPNSKSYGDITTVDFTPWKDQIDIITGGFPCQPYSVAGKRKGRDDERHLWPSMLRGISEIRPTWVVGENVRGLISWDGGLVFEEVQTDLEALGYEVQSFVLPAAGVGAPHRRERVWIVAHANGSSGDERFGQASDYGGRDSKEYIRKRSFLWNNARSASKIGIITDTIDGYGRRPHGRGFGGQGAFKGQSGQSGGSVRDQWKQFPTVSPLRSGNDGLPYELVRQRIRDDSNGNLSEKEIDKILSKAHTEWCRETIKAGGNAIVPRVALQIFKAVQQWEDLYGKKA